MKSIKTIQTEVEAVKREWNHIKNEIEKKSVFSVTSLQDSLMKHLESIRVAIDEYFVAFPQKRKRCIALLKRILDISENLKSTYLFPAQYDESLCIFDTMKMIKGYRNH